MSPDVVNEVARRLKELAGEKYQPLVAHRLRGGVPLEHDWVQTPVQPAILCSTVDQLGSRLLFRGYGVSDRMKPVHAGLLGNNTLILLDEAHLSEPFRQTLYAMSRFGHSKVNVSLLSATPGNERENRFTFSEQDMDHPVLARRLNVEKTVALKPVHKGGISTATKPFVDEARKIAARLAGQGIRPTAVGVMVNRVALARQISAQLSQDCDIEVVLMIGQSRAVDRVSVAQSLSPFRTGASNRANSKPLFIVATQCLEVGVDLDLDGLVSQAASLEALRQRFGRLNRAGREINSEGSIIALSEDIARKADDPVYGDRIRLTWEALTKIAEEKTVNFGVIALPSKLAAAGICQTDLESERPNAPVLMPAYIDLWSNTSPVPTADPDIGMFLHGSERATATVSIVWRDDISARDFGNSSSADLGQIMQLFPPKIAEAVEVPIWAVRRWLFGHRNIDEGISDAPQREPDVSDVSRNMKRKTVFRWAGHDSPSTGVVGAVGLRPGDLIVVPTEYGGCDRFGWSPESSSHVIDVADLAASDHWGRRCAVRITRNVVGSERDWKRVTGVLGSQDISGTELVSRLIDVLPLEVSDIATHIDQRCQNFQRDALPVLKSMLRANGNISVHYPYDDGINGGAILVAERGVEGTSTKSAVASTEDDKSSLSSHRPVKLEDHLNHVTRFVSLFAKKLGLSEVKQDLLLAAKLHDLGKADRRFQVMLAGGDVWNRPDKNPLAKSAMAWSLQAWKLSDLPKGWRHEALSVRMARVHPDFSTARDPALVLWLIGSHHGCGRPMFNFVDPSPDEEPMPCCDMVEWQISENHPGPQSPMFDFLGDDWPELFQVLRRKYGTWGLAHLESILRLADHRASEEGSSS